MSAAEKKPPKSTKKTVADVDEPGKSAPSATSKPVIVTNRPLLKDPMVVDDDAAAQKDTPEKAGLAHTTGPKLKPLKEPAETKTDTADTDTKEDKPETDKQPEPQPKAPDKPPLKETPAPEPAKPDEDSEDNEGDKGAAPSTDGPDQKTTKAQQKADALAAEQAKHDAAVQKLIDSGQYVLPINTVEKRKAKHFVALGILLAILLALAWGDIAADAGLIHIKGIKPVTHFFSN